MARDLRLAPILAAALVAAALLGTSGPAIADAEDDGRRHYRLGQQLLEAGDYRAAAAAFAAGHAAAPRAGFLLNMATCYRKLGELGKARQLYWRFLDAAPKDHASRAEVIAYLRTMEQIEADGVAVDGALPAAPASSSLVVAAPPVSPSTAPIELGVRDHGPAPSPPIYQRWWLWATVGAVLASGAAAYVLSQRPGSVSCGASLGCARE